MSSRYSVARTPAADLLNNLLVRVPFLPENPYEHRHYGTREDQLEDFSRHSIPQQDRNHGASSEPRQRAERRKMTCASPATDPVSDFLEAATRS